MMTVRKGCSECTVALIAAGADVNLTSSSRTTSGVPALISAAQCGFYDCIRILIDAGTDVNFVSAIGETALFHALNANSAKVLLASGAKINFRNSKGRNALQSWIVDKYFIYHKKLLKCLFAAGESPDDTTVRRIPLRGITSDTLRDSVGEPGIILKQMCRKTIRKHLLEVDPHTHLFERVTKLGLPEILSIFCTTCRLKLMMTR